MRFLAILALTLVFSNGSFAARPFPQHTTYQANSIKPNHVSQKVMDDTVRAKWLEWKSLYLKPAGNGKFFVEYVPSGGTVSEAHGYGMLLVATMEGYDPQAHSLFDGLVRYYQSHPSSFSRYLMAYRQNSAFQNIDGADSATDGDLDIAYALLMAHRQWGSAGTINYLAAAKNCINAIMNKEVNPNRSTLRLGDWATDGSSQGFRFADATRPSDFMLNHFKRFQLATGDPRWAAVTDKTYSVIHQVFTNHSPNTGLLPDFVVFSSSYRPAPGGFLEGSRDGAYSYNACRTPWRITTDYLISGDSRALPQLRKLNTWIRSQTGNNPDKIRAGYKLDGTPFVSFTDLPFTAPFGVSAMIDSSNQAWLNSIWSLCADSPASDYYADSIRLLSMLVMSGNWWAP